MSKKKLDVWFVITLLILGLYVLFMFYPLFSLFKSAVIDSKTGQFSLAYFQKFFSKAYYTNTVLNSFKAW